jgi:alpha-glucosidase
MGTWTGGASASWEYLRLSIAQVLNLSLSGVALVGADAGGFYETPDGELYTRWLQAAALMPLCRASGFAAANTPWAFGQPYELINRLTLQLRRRLTPFLYSLFALYREYGWMVAQPLFMLDPSLRDNDDAFLVGGALLAAPVLEKGAITRPVTLPEGVWYDFWSNEAIPGGQTILVTAPLERLPLFVRAGVVLPLLSESDEERLILRVYPGKGETVLYEDAGEGRTWATGDYRWVYQSCSHDERGALVVQRRIAGHYMPLYKTIHVEIVGLGHEPYDVFLDRQVAPLWFYEDDVLDITTDDSFQQIEVVYRVTPDDPTHRRPKRWR